MLCGSPGRQSRTAPAEIARVRRAWFPVELTTSPEGADVQIKNYLAVDAPWEPLGPTPIRDTRVPAGYYRVRIAKPGHVPLEIATGSMRSPISLTPEPAMPGMVPVEADLPTLPSREPCDCPTTGSTSSR